MTVWRFTNGCSLVRHGGYGGQWRCDSKAAVVGFGGAVGDGLDDGGSLVDIREIMDHNAISARSFWGWLVWGYRKAFASRVDRLGQVY